MVSICCASRHGDDPGDIRHALPSTVEASPVESYNPVDLHTERYLILNSDPSATVESLGLAKVAKEGVLTLYVVPRYNTSAKASARFA